MVERSRDLHVVVTPLDSLPAIIAVGTDSERVLFFILKKIKINRKIEKKIDFAGKKKTGYSFNCFLQRLGGFSQIGSHMELLLLLLLLLLGCTYYFSCLQAMVFHHGALGQRWFQLYWSPSSCSWTNTSLPSSSTERTTSSRYVTSKVEWVWSVRCSYYI